MSKLINSCSNWLSIKKIYPYAVVGILLLAVSIRFIGLDKGLWIDEEFSLGWLEKTDNFFQLIVALRDYNKPPCHFLLLYLWSKINNSEEFLRLFSVIFDLGMIVVVMNWLKRYSSLASILAGLYLTTTPIILRYSQEIRLYSLLVFATALAFSFASRVTAEPEKQSGYIGLALSLTLAVSTHLVAIMLIAPIAIFIFLMTMREKKEVRWGKALLAVTIPCLAFCFFYFFYLTALPQGTDNWWMPSISWNLISSTGQYVFGLSSLYFSSQLDNLIAFIFLGLLAIAVIFGKWKQNFAFLVAALIFWLEIIIYSLIETPIFFYRIVLPGMIPFVGFVVLQIATIERKNLKRASVVLLIILSIVFTANWVTVQAYRPVEYYKQVAQLVESEWQPNNLVVFYPGYISDTVKYYLKKIPKEAEVVAWDTNDIENIKSTINDQLANIDGEKLTTIFLVSRVDLTVRQEDFKILLSAIKSELKRPLIVKSFLIISHDFSFIKDSDKPNIFSGSLESELGKPLSYKDRKAYILSEYQLQK